MLASAESLTSD